MNKFDVVITGGGLSGLVTAIMLRCNEFDGSIAVVEERSYPFRTNDDFVITPIARVLFHNMPLYRKHNYCEGRYCVYNLVNEEYDLSFEMPDTAITGYSDFIYVLYEIAVNNGITLIQNTKALDYNFEDKYVDAMCGNIYFGSLVIAEGSGKHFGKNVFCGSDIEKYNFSVNKLPAKIEPIKSENIIYVGDRGGYYDSLADVNCTFAIISAYYAADVLSKGESRNKYYENMKFVAKELEAIKILKNNAASFEFIKEILIGARNYMSFL